MDDIKAEIERVKAASRKTHSEYLKRDYAKYIKRLQQKLRKRQGLKNDKNYNTTCTDKQKEQPKNND